MLKIGLTGGIASGKSTVASVFESHGIPVIYADKIAREVVATGSKGLNAIRQAFGESVIDGTGELKRSTLREIVFSDQSKKKLLESILHPLIRARSDELEVAARESGAPYVVFEIPLLLETGRHKDMNKVIVVDVSEKVQISRVMTRDNCSEDQAEKILAVQSKRADRLAIADDVILNEGDKTDLYQTVADLHEKYSALEAKGYSSTTD